MDKYKHIRVSFVSRITSATPSNQIIPMNTQQQHQNNTKPRSSNATLFFADNRQSASSENQLEEIFSSDRRKRTFDEVNIQTEERPSIFVISECSNQIKNSNEDDVARNNRRKRLTFWLIFIWSLLTIITMAALIISIYLLITMTNTSTINTTVPTMTSAGATTTTSVPCSPACNSQQRCVLGVCVGVGYLSTTLTWSRPGDGDIVVATPNGNIICWNNVGPSFLTDYGELDVDNQNGTGPENVFWSSSGSLPPTGTYYVCFSQYNFNPYATTTYPITATVTIMKSANITATFTRTFTSYIKNYTTCDASSNTLLGSFTYP